MSVSPSGSEADWAALGRLVAEEIQQRLAEEQEFIRRESEIQTRLVKRRWQELFGDKEFRPTVSPPVTTAIGSPLPIVIKAVNKRKARIASRPGITGMLQEAWATPEGQGLLLGLPLRALGKHFQVTHSSISENQFFKQKIRPLRERTRPAQKAASWLERNARVRD